MLKRMISLFLCMVMVISILPVQAFAADDVTDPTETVTEPTEGESAPTEPVTEPTEGEGVPTEPATEPSVETAAPSEPTVVVPETIESVSKEPAMSESTAGTVVNSGTCGDNLTWTLDSEGTLKIMGTGSMYDYSDQNETPWYAGSAPGISIPGIRTVEIEYGVTSIGNEAFDFEVNLNKVQIPGSVTHIGSNAFQGCMELVNVDIPEGVTSIGSKAFYFCEALTSVKLPSSVSSIGVDAFQDCFNLNGIWVDDRNEWFSSDDYGVLFNKTKSDLIQASHNLTAYTIPDSVTCIRDFAFLECRKLTTIIIPDSVITIGVQAFEFCVSLESVIIPDSVTDIGTFAFYGDSNLNKVTFCGNAPSFGDGVFCLVTTTVYYPANNPTWTSDVMAPDYNSNLTWVPYTPGEEPDDSSSGTCGENLTWTYADGVLTISGSGDMYDFTPAYAENPAPWTECYDVQTIVIEEGVTSIGDHAFEEFSFAEITLPEGLLSIGEDALPSYLVTLHLPASLTSFEDNWLFSLEEISVAEGNASFVVKDGVLFSKDMTRLVKMPSCLADDDDFFEYIVPNTVVEICSGALERCDFIDSLVLPDSLEVIGDKAVSCYGTGVPYGPETIIIPKNVKSIGSEALIGVKLIIFMGDAPVIAEDAFSQYAKLAYYPSNNSTWTSDKLQNYGGDLYWVSTNGDVPMFGSLTESINWEFDEATGTLTISGDGVMPGYIYSYLPNDFIPPWHHHAAKIKTLVIEDGIIEIGYSLFMNYRSLETVTLPSTLRVIGDYAFVGCNALKTVDMGEGVTNIGLCAFMDCSALTNIVIPETMDSIGEMAFCRCASLSDVFFTGNAPVIGLDIFCEVTASAHYPADNPTWTSDVMQDYGGTITWVAVDTEEPDDSYSGTCGENLTWTFNSTTDTLTISGTGAMTDFGHGNAPWYAKYQDFINKIIVNQGVTTIGDGAFYGLSEAVSISLPDGITSIGDYAVTACGKLTEIQLPESLVSLGEHGISNCHNLEAIRIPAKTTSIHHSNFVVCGNLETLIVDSQNPNYCSINNVLYNKNCTELIRCPGGYAGALTVLDSVSKIAEDAFWGNMKITSVEFPETVMQIGKSAFSNCQGLQEVVFHGNSIVLGDTVFWTCQSMKRVIFTGAAPTFGTDCFLNDDTTVYYPANDSTWTTSIMQNYGGNITWVPYTPGEEPGDSYSGTCGDNIRWTLDKDGNLRIEGTGEMEFYTAVYDETSQEDPNPDAVNDGPNTDVLYYTTPWLNIDGIKIKSVYIGDGVTCIGSHAFSTCDQLTEVRIPNTVTYIGMAAFSYCASLEEIDIPDSVTIIDNSVFYECHNLKRISIPAHVANIADWVFYNCKSLREITFCGDAPDFFMGTPQLFYGVTATAYYPANNPTWTADVMQDYGGTITWIVSGSEEPEIVASGTCGEDVIWTLDSKGTLTLSGTGATYDYSSGPAPWFTDYRTAIKSVIIEEGITRIGDYLFDTCSSMTSVVIPESVTEIGRLAFWYCRALTSVDIPDSVKFIYYGAFLGCEALESIRFNKVELLEDSVFWDCTNLREITFTWDAPAFEDHVFTNVTADVFYPGENYTWTEDIMQDYGGTITWIAYDPCPDGHTYQDGICTVCGRLENPIIDGGKTENTSWYITEDGTLTISGTGPMSGCGNIKRPWMDYELDVKKVIIEEGITTIGVYAFYQFQNLEEIVIPSTVTRIYELAFNWCKNLKSITLPESLQSIDSCGISYCKSLERITIPSTVTYMGVGALAGCENIKEIQFLGDAPQIGEPPPYVGDPMQDITATAYYPANNTTWTSDVMEKMGGNITWIPYGAVENRVTVDATDLGGQTSVWIDGMEYAVQIDGDSCYVDLQDGNANTMIAYTYHVEDSSDIHTQYPVSMKVWTLSNEDGFYTVTRVGELDDILQYSGASIRVTGKKGIRMITSVEQAKKNALTSDGLAGYTLKEYGTVVAWASQMGDNPLVLGKSYSKSNYAYKKDVADPVFAYAGDLMQYTNVLVGFTNAQCQRDLAMRPYMILEDAEGNEITLYGGIVQRSIGYIAYQNRAVFNPKTEAYEYVWDIIHSVYGDAYDAEYVA